MFEGLPRPLLIAHRGASQQAPENTLEAFDLALRLGAQVLELDVHLSRDGEVVVIHDATVERTTDGQGEVRSQSCAELQALDAGYWFAPTPGEYVFRGHDLTIPRLLDVLQAFPRAAFNIELKQRQPSMVRAVLDVLARAGSPTVLLAAADPAVMSELEEARPGCALGLSTPQAKAVIRGAYLGRVPRHLRGRAMQVPLRHPDLARGWLPIVTRPVLWAAHRAGIEVHLWTINDPCVAQRWLRRGADGLITDDPSGLLEAIEAARTKRHGGEAL